MNLNRKIILATLIDKVLEVPAHQEIFIPRDDIPDAISLGFRPDIGEPAGQSADYRLALKDGRSVHARKYRRFWGFHWDKVDPRVNAVEHLRRDSPGTYTLASISIGSGVGAGIGALAKGKKGAVAGALIGALLGALFAVLTAEWE